MTDHAGRDAGPERLGAQETPAASPAEVRAAAELAARRSHRHQPLSVFTALQSLLYVLILCLFAMTFTVQPIRIPSPSMEPTLLVGDFLLLNRQAVAAPNPFFMPPAGIARGDLVVFHDPVDDPGTHLVKRVIGLPGDRIHLRHNVVYLNERPLREPYAAFRTSPADSYRDDFPSLGAMDARVEPAWWIRLRELVQAGEIQVPPGNYFVLGDNRNESDDSRYWGFVPGSFIVGDPLLVYFSWLPPDSDSANPAGLTIRWRRLFHVVR